MLVFPVSPIKPVARVVRSAKSDKSEETETETQAVKAVSARSRSPKREGKAFYQSPNERSSLGVQAALLDLPKTV